MEGAPGVEHHPETIDETWGAQVHFDKYEDRSFSVDGDVQIETSGKGGADFLREMDFEGEEEIIGKWHRGIKALWGAMGNRNVNKQMENTNDSIELSTPE